MPDLQVGSALGSGAQWVTAEGDGQSALSLTDSATGRVGIGTTSPGARLHIKGPGYSAGGITWPDYDADKNSNSFMAQLISVGGNGDNSSAGSGPSGVLAIGEYYDSRGIITMVDAGGNSPSDQGTGCGKDLMVIAGRSDNTNGRTGGKLYLQGGSGYNGGAFNTNYGGLVLQALGGNVGIGTPAPNTTLEVSKGAGTGEILRLSGGSNNPRMKVSVDGADTSIEAMSGNNLRFGTSGGGIQLTVANSGRVGINKTAPEALLEIKGNSVDSNNDAFRISDPDGNEKLAVRENGRIDCGWDGKPAGVNHGGASIIMAPSAIPGDQNAAVNRANIQNAINQAAYNGGGTVILQKGVYLVDQNGNNGFAIEMKHGVVLQGCSMFGTILRSIAANISIIRMEPPGGMHRNMTVRDLMLDGNQNAGITGIEVYTDTTANSPQPVLIQNVYALWCATGIRVRSWFTEISNCQIDNSSCGIRLEYENDDTNASTVLHCMIRTVAQTGIYIKGGVNQIIGCNIQAIADAGYGIHVAGANSFANYLAANYIETGSGSAIGIRIESPGNTVSGNYFNLISGNEISWAAAVANGKDNVSIGNFRNNGSGNIAPLTLCMNRKLELRTSEYNGGIYGFLDDAPNCYNAYSLRTAAGSGNYTSKLELYPPTSGFASPRACLQAHNTGGGALWLANAGGTTTVDIESNGNSYFNGGNVGVGVTSSPQSKLQVNGSVGVKVVTAATSGYMAGDETVILVSFATGTINLPQASTVPGRTYYIKKISSTGTTTIDGYGSETIDGSTIKTLTTQYQGMQIVSNGTAWYILAL